MTETEVKPASSAVRAMSASRSNTPSGPTSGKLKFGRWRSSSIGARMRATLVPRGGAARAGTAPVRGGSGQRDELRQERPRRLRVEAVVHVRGPAHRVAGDGDRGDDVRVAEEVRPARVAVARAAVAGGGVHRDPQPRR